MVRTVSRLALLFLALEGAIAFSVHAQDTIRVGRRPLVFTRQRAADLVRGLQAGQQAEVRTLMRLARAPTAEDRAALAADGVTILSPFAANTYWVRVRRGARLRSPTARAAGVADVQAVDKVLPDLWDERLDRFVVTPRDSAPRNYVRNADGTVNALVTFHADVIVADARGVLARYTPSASPLADRRWLVRLSLPDLRRLAAEDLVRWIDAAPMPPLPDNNVTRVTINADAVQLFNTTTGVVGGLGGRGVRMGVFDAGVNEGHDDLGARVVVNGAGAAAHGTHVAGIAAGSGLLSNQANGAGNNNGGSAFQWRGMAPLAEILDLSNGLGGNAVTHATQIGTNGLDLSNHSYTFSTDGAYDASNELRDDLMRGDAVSGGLAVPARLHVYSAGNHGGTPFNGGEQVGYFALTKQVKNGLLVGNWNAATARIANTSSLGPAHDGRIKPDVVAPGSNVRSTGLADDYVINSGTSMAAPAVTGLLALALEQWATTHGVNLDQNPPWPSTLRGLAIQTATDVAGPVWFNNPDGAVQAFAGPDFVTGWGLVHAQRAVQLVASRLIIQDALQQTCDAQLYYVLVAPGTPELRVTLAWDDPGGNPALARTDPKLVNDLDLTLVAPGGTPRYPWLLDQRAVDAAGNAVPDASQTCGTGLTIQRQFNPTPNPNFDPVNPANNVNDPMPPGGPPVAVTGRDHLNNVERVDVANPAPGLWRVEVSGFNVAEGPQRFSVLGFKPWGPHVFDRGWLCRRYPGLCRKIDMRLVCQRHPQLCDPMVIDLAKGKILVTLVDPSDRFIVPLKKICQFVIDCPGCTAGRCPGFSARFAATATPLQLWIYDDHGRRVWSGRTDRARSVTLPHLPGRELFLVVRSVGKAPGGPVEVRVDAPLPRPIH